MIDLTIKTLDSLNHTFTVPDTFTVLELKEHIVEKVNVPVIQQRLIFCGRVLSNEAKLADIGIHGKVMHLVQKAPRLATTTSGASSSTTTNANSRQGQNVAPGFRGWHAYDPTVVFGAIGIPSEFINAGELPRMINPRNTQTYNRISVGIDMVRKGHEILNRLENVDNNGLPSATDGEQIPEGSQQAESTLRNVPPESSTPQTQSDPDSVNVSYEVDDTFPNTVVVTIDATHHMRMSPGLMRHVQSQLHGANHLHTPSPSSSTDQNVQRETQSVPETTSVGPTNQTTTEQPTRPSPGPPYDQNTRSAAATTISERRRLRELIEQLNKLNSRLQPFYTLFCQYLVEDPRFESAQGERGSTRAQIVYNCVSEVLHYISHIYHLISDLRVSFSRPPIRLIQSRPYLMQGAILHTAHSVTTTPPTTQQPTSTQTTNSSQSIPSVRAFRLDLMNPEAAGNETPSVSTPATSTADANVTVDSNTERNNPSTEVPPVRNGLSELLFDFSPGAIHIDTVEAAFMNSNSSGSTPPTDVSQPPISTETSNNSMPIDWVDQMIDVISSGVRRPFVSEQSLDWGSIPTTSTQTPRVTPRTADSSSTTNPPPTQVYGTRPTIPRADPFLPCNSFHFESNLRPVVLARRTQGTDRPTSSANNSNPTTEPPMPVLAELRPGVGRRTGRPRARYVHDIDGFMSGIHPILNFGRNNRFSTNAPSPVSINAQGTGQTVIPTDAMTGGHIRVDIGSVFDRIEREGFERGRDLNIQPPSGGPALGLETTIIAVPPQPTARQPNELLLAPIGNIPFFRRQEGRFLLLDLFLLIARDWTLHDIINMNTTEQDSTIVQFPVSRNSGALLNFFLDRIMRNQPPNNHNIEEAANRIFLEMVSYIHVFQCSVPTRSNIDLNASIRRCILHNIREIAVFCDENRATSTITNILPSLILFAEAILSLIVYCCNNRAVFRLCISSLMQFLPLPPNLHQVIMDEIRLNVDQYWNNMASSFRMGFPVVDFIVPFDSNEFEVGQTSRVGNEEQSSNSTLTSQEIANEPLPEVVIGSQEWHHSVPSEWVPVITRDTQRQRRQGAQPPYSDAYLSGMPNKRRKMVTSSKSQGSISQIIAKNLEVAMGAAGVTINKEAIAIVGADINVQHAYSERIKSIGRSGLETHPDFSPDRYPNAFKFFCDHNCSN